MGHFTDKARVWDEIKTLGFQAAVAIEPAFYWTNLDRPGFISEGSSGSAVLNLPLLDEQDYVTGFDPDDTGDVFAVHAIVAPGCLFTCKSTAAAS